MSVDRPWISHDRTGNQLTYFRFTRALNFICLLKGQSQQILDHILGSLKLNQYFHKNRLMFLNFYYIYEILESSVKTACMKKLSLSQ